jgi:hypothetical protein
MLRRKMLQLMLISGSGVIAGLPTIASASGSGGGSGGGDGGGSGGAGGSGASGASGPSGPSGPSSASGPSGPSGPEGSISGSSSGDISAQQGLVNDIQGRLSDDGMQAVSPNSISNTLSDFE